MTDYGVSEGVNMVRICVMPVVSVFSLSIGCSHHGVCGSLYLWVPNSGVGPDEKKTSIEANKHATVCQS
jgi:hypothetical protein